MTSLYDRRLFIPGGLQRAVDAIQISFQPVSLSPSERSIVWDSKRHVFRGLCSTDGYGIEQLGQFLDGLAFGKINEGFAVPAIAQKSH